MSWFVDLLDTSGFAALAALGGVVVGALLQPWVTRRIRTHEDADGWKDRARNVAADTDGLLRRLSFDITHEVAIEASKNWVRDVERSILLLGRFYPDAEVRKVARALWGECRRAANLTVGFGSISDADARLRASERQKEATGEATYALDKLVELLGGEPSRSREEIDYTLRSDRKAGYKQAWE